MRLGQRGDEPIEKPVRVRVHSKNKLNAKTPSSTSKAYYLKNEPGDATGSPRTKTTSSVPYSCHSSSLCASSINRKHTPSRPSSSAMAAATSMISAARDAPSTWTLTAAPTRPDPKRRPRAIRFFPLGDNARALADDVPLHARPRVPLLHRFEMHLAVATYPYGWICRAAPGLVIRISSLELVPDGVGVGDPPARTRT